MGVEGMDVESIEFAVAVWREDGQWLVSSLPAKGALSVELLTSALRRLPGEGGVFGIVGIVDECFVALRSAGESVRAVVSDGAAILDWALAAEVADLIGLEFEDEDLEEFEPVGDLAIFADFGLGADELRLLCADEDLYPDEQVTAIAKRLGFDSELASVLRSD